MTEKKSPSLPLLKFRGLFDRYIIKRDQAENWSLLTLEYYARDRNSSFSYNNSFDQDELSGVNKQLAMILSMFHVSHPAYVYKRWLNRSLAILNTLTSDQLNVDGAAYLRELEQLSHEFLSEICGETEQFNVEMPSWYQCAELCVQFTRLSFVA